MPEGLKVRPSVAGDAVSVAMDAITTAEGEDVLVQRMKLVQGAPGAGVDVSQGAPLWVLTRQAGTYAYAAGAAPATVDVPGAARLTRVAVVAGAAAATVTIGGGATITIAANGAFDEQIPGEALGADVVIAGSVAAYYVAWVV